LENSVKKPKKVIIGAVLFLLLFASFAQAIAIKPAAATTKSSLIWRSEAGSSWYASTIWYNENNVAYDVCNHIEDLYNNYRSSYNWIGLYQSASVTTSYINSFTSTCSSYDYATVFNYAHGGTYTYNAVIYNPPFYVYYVPITHYLYYAYDGDVLDRTLYNYAGGSSGSHKFVFQYTCAQANIVGYYDDDEYDVSGSAYLGTGPVGFSYAWTGQDYTALSSNGYASPDMGSYCYLGFVDWSKPLCDIANTDNGKTYGDFVKTFYERLLINNESVKTALNYASNDVWGTSFGDSPLNTGYYDYLPGRGWWYGQMRVFGNGNNGVL